jgi:hypothetical protein
VIGFVVLRQDGNVLRRVMLPRGREGKPVEGSTCLRGAQAGTVLRHANLSS